MFKQAASQEEIPIHSYLRWRQEDGGLNVEQAKRLRPEHKDHVWSYDFVQARTRDGRAFRVLAIIDEFTRECLAIDVARKLNHDDGATIQRPGD